MSVETHVHRALEAVVAERETVDEKRGAFERFDRRLAEVAVDRTATSSTSVPPAGTPRLQDPGSAESACRAVRTAFAETLAPHCSAAGTNGSVRETLQSEFGESIALALAPATDACVTPTLKRTLRTEAERRKREVTALRDGLEREATELESTIEVVDDVTAWLEAADETPLSDLGFDGLRARHEQLATFQATCEERLASRQAFLAGNTSVGGTAGIRHRELIVHAYREFPVDHPVLATVLALQDCCETSQRTVRRHLVRRV